MSQYDFFVNFKAKRTYPSVIVEIVIFYVVSKFSSLLVLKSHGHRQMVLLLKCPEHNGPQHPLSSYHLAIGPLSIIVCEARVSFKNISVLRQCKSIGTSVYSQGCICGLITVSYLGAILLDWRLFLSFILNF